MRNSFQYNALDSETIHPHPDLYGTNPKYRPIGYRHMYK